MACQHQFSRNKMSLKSSLTGSIHMENVRLTRSESLLPKVVGLKGPLRCLHPARNSLGWGALGAAVDCYERAGEYTESRPRASRREVISMCEFPIGSIFFSKDAHRHSIRSFYVFSCACFGFELGLDEPWMTSMVKNNSCQVARTSAQTAADFSWNS